VGGDGSAEPGWARRPQLRCNFIGDDGDFAVATLLRERAALLRTATDAVLLLEECLAIEGVRRLHNSGQD
jgi:hypothetical protein